MFRLISRNYDLFRCNITCISDPSCCGSAVENVHHFSLESTLYFEQRRISMNKINCLTVGQELDVRLLIGGSSELSDDQNIKILKN